MLMIFKFAISILQIIGTFPFRKLQIFMSFRFANYINLVRPYQVSNINTVRLYVDNTVISSSRYINILRDFTLTAKNYLTA